MAGTLEQGTPKINKEASQLRIWRSACISGRGAAGGAEVFLHVETVPDTILFSRSLTSNVDFDDMKHSTRRSRPKRNQQREPANNSTVRVSRQLLPVGPGISSV